MQHLFFLYRFIGKLTTLLFVILLLNLSMITSSFAQEKKLVFDALRLEISNNPSSATEKYYDQDAKNKWESIVSEVLSVSDMQQFFSFSSILIVEQTDFSVDMIYFNPWVDCTVLMKWKRKGNNWRVNDFSFVSGEMLRNEIIDEKNILPPWLKQPNALASNMGTYYSKTLSAIGQINKETIDKYFSVELKDEASLSLIALAVRLNTRIVTAQAIFGSDELKIKNTQKMLNELKNVIKSKNKITIGEVVKTNDPKLIESLMLLPESVVSSFVGNWYIEKQKGQLLVLMSSFISPRLFIIVAGDTSSGETDWVLLGDWLTLSNQFQ